MAFEPRKPSMMASGPAHADCVSPPGIGGISNDACIVPAIAEHEGKLRVRQRMPFEYRTPRRHVIGFSGDGEDTE